MGSNRVVMWMFVAASAALAAAACSPSEGGSGYPDGGDHAGDSACPTTTRYCSADQRQVLQCNPATGEVLVVSDCPADRWCVSGACSGTCRPGETECVTNTTYRICRTDGTGWDETDCASGATCNPEVGLCEALCELRIFILLDQSGSMSDGTPSKWDQARQALRTLMTSPEAAGIEFGFGAFPTDGNCGTGGLVIHPIPDATSSVVDSYLGGHSPNGATPLKAALEEFITGAADVANLVDPAYHNAILVVSDGQDTCLIDCLARCGFNFSCLTACEAEAEALAAEALANVTIYLRDNLQIRSFVIGFGADVSDAELSAIAVNGGTAIARWIPADNVDELTAALSTIVAEMEECNPILR